MSKETELKHQEEVNKAIQKLDTSAFTIHKLTVEEALTKLKTDPKKGLTTTEAEKRLKENGPNELDAEPETSLLERVLEQFKDLLVQILLGAAIISFILALTGDGEEGMTAFVEPFVIMCILVINATVAVWQDSNADNALEALKNMQAQECKCLRDGVWITIEAVSLVPGDIVSVHTGDCVPADLRIVEIQSIALQAGQAALTGESVSVQKTTKNMGNDAKMLQDQKNMLFSSTVISSGNAIGVVSYTGMKTAIGSVHKEVSVAGEDEADTPLKIKLDEFGEKLAKVIFVICFLVWAMNFNKFFDPVHGSVVKGCIYYFKIAVALAVAAIPEGLPAVITTCLALGTRKMAQNNCIVRRLPSVETLGCTSTICSDKTGTLTKNEMSAVKFGIIGESVDDLVSFDVEENSYSPIGKVSRFTSNTWVQFKNMKAFQVVCSVNNRARILIQDSTYKIQGEPTEAALKVFAEKLAYNSGNDGKLDFKNKATPFSDEIEKTIKKIATLDFSSERKCMSTVVTGFNNQSSNVVLLKGAPERVIEKCSSVMTQNGNQAPLNAKQKAVLIGKIQEVASQGFRVLAVGIALDGGQMTDVTTGNASELLADTSKYATLESGCSFLGYICIKDPVRPEVKQAIADCRTAGINVIMITGDSKETAIAIAQELDIIKPGQNIQKSCFTGAEFEALSDQNKKKALEGKQGKVFSRVEPRHKRELVKILIQMGEIVAMTGDGVNDAPALKQAHIGIAMGITGTEVAKQASDMVLADDNFATIVKAVEEGRSIYSNMKAFIRYLISSNIGEVASIFFTAALGIPESFNSVQLLWVNLVTDGFPATALGFNPPDKDVMKQQPRKSDDSLISNWTFIRYIVIGMYVGFATVGIFIYWYTIDQSVDGHTLVTFAQLSHWTQCPTWTDFKVNDFVQGMDLQKNPCDYFTKGKVKAATLSLSVLVMIEMFNAYNAISEDSSLLTVTPLVNPYLIAATFSSTLLHAMIVYVPFFNEIFSIHAMTLHEWFLVIAFAFPVIIIDEVLKFFARKMNTRELEARLKQE